MKNKKLKYILFPAVFIIWGLVVYKIFFYSDDPSENPTSRKQEEVRIENNQVQESYALMADYRDPFLDAPPFYYSQSVKIDNIPENSEIKPEINKTSTTYNKQVTSPVKWPQIKYNGLVVNKKSDKRLGIMQLNGKKLLIEENGIYENIQIMYLYDDSVIAKNQNENKTYHK